MINNKISNISGRMFTKKELDGMGLTYIEGSIFLNISAPGKGFPAVTEDIKKHMLVVNYTDFSGTVFSENLLDKSVSDQLNVNSNKILWLSKFKDENPYETRMKLDTCKDLKKLRPDLYIVLEIPFSSDIPVHELDSYSEYFDALSLFYGLGYGHLNQLNKIVGKIVEFRQRNNKKVIVMGAPVKFSGDNLSDVRLMPCFDLIADLWSKWWNTRGGPKEIKITDTKDLKLKTYKMFLEEGYPKDYILPEVSMTLKEIFEGSLRLRRSYEQIVFDGVIREVQSYNPSNIENNLYRRFHNKYFIPILTAYNDRIISILFKSNPMFLYLPENDRAMLESELRKEPYSSKLYDKIRKLIEFSKENPDTEASILIEMIK